MSVSSKAAASVPRILPICGTRAFATPSPTPTTPLSSKRKLNGGVTPDDAANSTRQTNISNINQYIVRMEYAVRGLLPLRANELDRELKAGKKLPFKDIIYCNIGNPQSLSQPPITFIRQVLSLCMAPFLMDHPNVTTMFPADVIARAKHILSNSHGVGAYSESKGLPIIRQTVAEFIARRDGFPADPEVIFLTSGASEGVKLMLSLLIRDHADGVLVPIPQYPLYSASVVQFGGTLVGYHLDESSQWSLDMNELRKKIAKAKADGIIVRCVCVINPGNPTGQLLPVENMREVVRLCEENGLVLFADEVYQANVYTPGSSFVSFKKIVSEMKSPIELVSFHSVSKGMLGECGLRGGYMELVNFLPEVVEQVYKTVSVELCSNVPGQICVDLMCNPPREGQPSYELYRKEYDAIYTSLKTKAKKLADGLNHLRGVRCEISAGAMYAFPSITLGPKIQKAASEVGLPPDTYYCLKLLENTGVCVVPGSGFGQKDGTFHFRTTFLPPDHKIDEMVQRIRAFHMEFASE